MICILNKGLILEQEIIQALKDYCIFMDIEHVYQYITLNITNNHPFATLLFSNTHTGTADATSLFPALVVTTERDSKPSQLDQLAEMYAVKIGKAELSTLVEQGYMITDEIQNHLMVACGSRPELYGIGYTIWRTEQISIEIWSENIQIKNELYELIRLFVCGFMKDYLTDHQEQRSIALFDNTITGERSNNYNEDFGLILHGARLTFEVDYRIEQIILDTAIQTHKIEMMEVRNHARGYAGTTRSIITGGGSTGDNPGGGTDGSNGTDDGTPGTDNNRTDGTRNHHTAGGRDRHRGIPGTGSTGTETTTED
jgi:hypothetical protein